MTAVYPRVVVVTRETEYELLLARHATLGQAAYFLETRGQAIEEVKQRHATFQDALATVLKAIPTQWRTSRVLRGDLDRFLFEPTDTIVAVGQDGLVANVAKYLRGQHVMGINPDQERNEGVLVPHPPEAAADLLLPAAEGKARTQGRVMAQVTIDDGPELFALNELFVGIRTHQSARYRIGYKGEEERQSSSGIIVATGTGATGWARSINRERHSPMELPDPEEERMVFFVREAWPSVATGTGITEGSLLHAEDLTVTSDMNAAGVIFGDGIEDDYLPFDYGTTARVRLADRYLNLVL
jgi:NAD kinase